MSQSLHDLIYGDEQEAPQSSPNDVIYPYGGGDRDEQKPSQTTSTPQTQHKTTSRSRSTQQKKKRNNGTKILTPKERHESKETQRLRTNERARAKTKKWDFESEVDYGNAMYHYAVLLQSSSRRRRSDKQHSTGGGEKSNIRRRKEKRKNVTISESSELKTETPSFVPSQEFVANPKKGSLTRTPTIPMDIIKRLKLTVLSKLTYNKHNECLGSILLNQRPNKFSHWRLGRNEPLMVDSGSKKKSLWKRHGRNLELIASRLLLNGCGADVPFDDLEEADSYLSGNDDDNMSCEAMAMTAVELLFLDTDCDSRATAYLLAKRLIAPDVHTVDEQLIAGKSEDWIDEDQEQVSVEQSEEEYMDEEQIANTFNLWREMTSNSLLLEMQRIKKYRRKRRNAGGGINRKNERLPKQEYQQTPSVLTTIKEEKMNLRQHKHQHLNRSHHIYETLVLSERNKHAHVSHFTLVHMDTFHLSMCLLLYSIGATNHEMKERGYDDDGNHDDDDEGDDYHYTGQGFISFKDELKDIYNAGMELCTNGIMAMLDRNFGTRVHCPSYNAMVGLRMTQSFICNSGLAVPDEEDNKHGDNNQEECKRRVAIGNVANALIKIGDKHKDERQLQYFSSIHITHAVAVMVYALNRYSTTAAEILSQGQSCPNQEVHVNERGNDSTTPIDLMRCALNEYYKSSSLDKRKIDAQLEEEREDMLLSFQKAIQILQGFLVSSAHIDATLDYDFHVWYLAALSGAMLLSSNIELTGDDNQRPSPPNLPDGARFHGFKRLRGATSDAFLALLSCINTTTNNNFQANSKYYFIISTFLEWNQVSFLLCRHGHEGDYLQMRKLHAHSTLLHAASSSSLISVNNTLGNNDRIIKRVHRLMNKKLITTDAYLHILANRLEIAKCDELALWWDFVKELGTIGQQVDDSGNDYDACIKKEDEENEEITKTALRCSKSNKDDNTPCDECCRLNTGYVLNHEQDNARRYNNTCGNGTHDDGSCFWWWGKNREWWEDYYFDSLPKIKNVPRSSYEQRIRTIENVSNRILTLQLAPHAMDAIVHRQEQLHYKRIHMEGIGIGTPYQDEWIDWLRRQDDTMNAELYKTEDDMDEDENDQRLIGVLLDADDHTVQPNHTLKKEMTPSSPSSCLWSTSSIGNLCQVVACKTIVACHLFGVMHPFVRNSICWLAELCGKEEEVNEEEDSVLHNSDIMDCDAFRALIWLSMQGGLNVVALLNDGVKEAQERECRRKANLSRRKGSRYRFTRV